MVDFIISPLRFSSQVEASALMMIPNLEEPEAEKSNFSAFALTPEQTHSCNVGIAKRRYDCFPDTDALITFERDLPVGVHTADCVPIVIYAEDIPAVAAVHAGWKGTLNGIVDKTLDILFEHGDDPTKIFVVFGPSISQKSYEVDQSLADEFIEAGFGEYVSSEFADKKKPHIDLQGVNAERFRRRGIPESNIKLSDSCTFDSKDSNGDYLYPSYRRNKTKKRMLTAVSLLDPAGYEKFRQRYYYL